MNARKDERWLDAELRRVINTSKPEFDAEAWKRRYGRAFAALTARSRRPPGGVAGAGRRVRLYAGALAAAAVILVAAAVLLRQAAPGAQQRPGGDAAGGVASAAQVVSMRALRTAYNEGGEEALHRQLDAALKQLGPRPGALSAHEILRDLES